MSNAINTIRRRTSWRSMRRSAQSVAALIAITALTVATSPEVACAAFGGWEFQPYRIHARLAIDVQGGLAEELAGELPIYLQNRVETSFAPMWVFKVELATGTAGAKVFEEIDASTPEKPGDLPKDTDKLIVLAVRSTPLGLELAAREYDQYVERWSVPIIRECRQASSLPEQLFALMWHTFSPLAQVDPDPNDPKRAMLRPRGSELPRSEGTPPWAKVGDVFLPIVRRTARGGQLVENGIQPVPWTYIEAVEPQAPFTDKDKPKEKGQAEKGNEKEQVADKEKPKAAEKPVAKGNSTFDFQVHSGSRRPFVGRKSSRLEQLAIGIRADAEPTTLRFHARKNEKKPLIGYEALVQKPGIEEPARVAVSDPAGEVVLQPGDKRVQLLVVKHGGQLLAKLPVVPGAEKLVKIPLPDDDARLAAEARLAALREDLIDVVARRNILIARARKRIESKDFKGAQDFLRTLDELPGKPQFKLQMDTSARLLRSDDPMMQRKIDGLFSQTQTLMNQFLDIKPISQINNELREAQRGGATRSAVPPAGGASSTASTSKAGPAAAPPKAPATASNEAASPTGSPSSPAAQGPTPNASTPAAVRVGSTVSGWTRVRDGALSIEMPSEPTKSSEATNSPAGPLPTNKYLLEQSTHGYTFTITQYDSAFDPNVFDQLFDNMRDNMVKQFRGQLTSSRRIDVQGNSGIEFGYKGSLPATSEGPELSMAGFARLIIVQNQLIIIQIVGESGAVKQNDANTFFDTFQVTAE